MKTISNNWFLPTSIFLIVFLSFILVLPNVNTGLADADELMTVAKVLGVAHPPSYPLYVVLAAIIGRIPIPILSFAGRVNLLSTILHACLAVLFFYNLIFLLEKFIKERFVLKIIAATAILTLTFTPSFILYGVISEVFSLNNFFAVLTFYFLLLWSKKIGRGGVVNKYLFLAVFSFGLGLSNQQAIVLMLPAFAFWVISFYRKAVLNYKLILLSLAVVLVGFLLPYIYLPISASHQPVINWENPVTVEGVLRVITRRVYAENSSTGSAYIDTRVRLSDFIPATLRFYNFLIKEYGLGVFLVGLFGIAFLTYKKQYRILIFLILSLLGGGWFFTFYSPFPVTEDYIYYKPHLGILERFFLLGSVFWIIAVAYGMLAIFLFTKDFVLASFSDFKVIRYKKYLILLLVLAPLSLFLTKYLEVKNNDFTAGHQYGVALLNSLEKNAVLLCYSEQSCFTGVYLQEVEGLRRDITIVQAGFSQVSLEQFKQKYPGILKTSIDRAFSNYTLLIIRDLIRSQIMVRSVYIAGINNDPTALSAIGIHGDPFFLIPYGCSMKVSLSFEIMNPPPECSSLVNKYLHSPHPVSLPITDMFPSYLAYQGYISAAAYSSHGCQGRALSELAQTIALEPKYLIARDAYFELNKTANKAICKDKIMGPKFEDLVTKSKEAEQKNDLDYALYYQDQAADLRPNDVAVRIRLASLYIRSRAYDNAEIEYLDVLKIDPENKEALDGVKYLDTVIN